MVGPEESRNTRLSKERRIGPRAETQQAKVSVSGSSGFAPVNTRRLIARPIQLDPDPFVEFHHHRICLLPWYFYSREYNNRA